MSCLDRAQHSLIVRLKLVVIATIAFSLSAGQLTAQNAADKKKSAKSSSSSLTVHPPESLEIGKVAPEIEAPDLDGVNFRLSDYRGKVVVIDFWGDW